MQRLIVCMLAGNTQDFIDMAIESVKEADKIIIVYDTTSKDKTGDKIFKWQERLGNNKLDVIQRVYEHEDSKGNGRARNHYLKHLKEFYPDDWCIVIDADEVVEDIIKVKEFIQTANPNLYSVHMRHFIGDLAHEDATQDKHYVLNRLFRISCAGEYHEVEHPVLLPLNKNLEPRFIDCTTIWHLAYCGYLFDIKKRYDNHMKKSNIHTPQFLRQWYYWHLFGTYPKKQFNPIEIPKVILDNFGIDKDELYFQGRHLENKHWIDVIKYKEYFKL